MINPLRTIRRKAISAGVGPLLAFGLATVALGYFSAFGSGVGVASAGTLASPAPVVASPQIAAAHITWAIVSSPSGVSSALTYTVDRSADLGSTWAPASGTCTGSLARTTTACDDLVAASGTYRYRVTAHFRSWTSAATSGSVVIGVDTTSPTVTSIDRSASSPTHDPSVSWTVTFTESVSGVDASDFALVNTGLGGTPAITSVSGGPASYTVTASTGTGSGTLGLNLVDNDSIVDASNNRLGGPGTGNGNFTGQVYTVDRTAPTVTLTKVNGATVAFPYTTGATVTSVGGACGTVSGDVATVSWSVTGGSTQSGSTSCSGGSWMATLTVPLTTSGVYALTATQSDTALNVGSSGAKSVTIDKTGPTAVDIQATNGGSSGGTIDAGDIVVYTFSEPIDPNTVLAAWTGTSHSVTVSLNDVTSNDTLTVTGVNLGTVALGGNYMESTRTVTANMVMSGSTITVTLTSGPPPGQENFVASSSLVWSPSTSARDAFGNATAATPATESGSPKRNF